MSEFGIELFERWVVLWNGDLAVAEEIIAPEVTLRYAQPGADAFDTIRDPQALAKRIDEFRAERPGLRYVAQGVPVVQADGERSGIIARPYGASRPTPDGVMNISGTDILRFVDGKIAEVWSVSGGANGRSFYPVG
jgi:hypothetical protein